MQIDVEHPLEWHIGYQSIDQKTLLLISNVEIDRVESSKSMVVTRRRREDNRWVLSFGLLKKEQQSVCSILCCDVIDSSRLAASEKDSLIKIFSREQKYYHSATQHYRIDDNFPKLTSQSVSAQIIAAHYELSLPSLVDWLIE